MKNTAMRRLDSMGKAELTQWIRQLQFTMRDLALYLDTHREDCEALELYRAYQKMYEKCKMEYQRKHGPMNHGSPSESNCYDWLNDPWPWEYCKNKEVF